MYFQNFPYTYYSLDNAASAQLITNIGLRAKFSDAIKNNYSLFDEYDIKDGETPELIADKFYSNPQLHWIILLFNDILDPRFEWPLTTDHLIKYVEGKYANTTGVHHFEDGSGTYVNGNVTLTTNRGVNIVTGTVIVNSTSEGVGLVTDHDSNVSFTLQVTTGGFNHGDKVYVASNAASNANVTSAVIISGVPITNYQYEDTVNETKRRIRLLKPQYIDAIIREFKKQMGA